MHRLTLHSFFVTISYRICLIWLRVDFWLFPKLKRPRRGWRFESIWGDKSWIEEGADGYTGNGLFGMFRGLGKNRWHKCISSRGDYFIWGWNWFTRINKDFSFYNQIHLFAQSNIRSCMYLYITFFFSISDVLAICTGYSVTEFVF